MKMDTSLADLPPVRDHLLLGLQISKYMFKLNRGRVAIGGTSGGAGNRRRGLARNCARKPPTGNRQTAILPAVTKHAVMRILIPIEAWSRWNHRRATR